MKKTDAIALFGPTQTHLADALRVTRQAISMWPDELTNAQCDRVLGALVRTRRPSVIRQLTEQRFSD